MSRRHDVREMNSLYIWSERIESRRGKLKDLFVNGRRFALGVSWNIFTSNFNNDFKNGQSRKRYNLNKKLNFREVY